MRIGIIVSLLLLPMTNVVAQQAYDYAANCRAWPAAQGPHPIGTIDFELTDSIRSAEYAPAPTPMRRLYVRAWYPAADTAGIPARPYFTEAESRVLPKVILELLGRPADTFRNCAQLATNAHQGARPAPGRFPVVSFNHGTASYATQNSVLAEHLAANGYVVLAFGHPYETAGIVYPNGDTLLWSPRMLEDLIAQGPLLAALPTGGSIPDRVRAAETYARAARHSSFGQLPAVWREDVLFVFDRLAASLVPNSVKSLAAAIDDDRHAHMGMSYGGYVAALTAQGDGRARAAINLDGGNWTYDLIDAEVRTPFLMLNMDLTLATRRMRAAGMKVPPGPFDRPVGPRTPTHGDVAYERVATAGARPDIHRIIIPGVLHESFSDLSASIGDSLMRSRAGDSAAVAGATVVQNDMVLAFLDRYVKGQANDFPSAVLKRHPQLIVRDRSDIRRQAAAVR